MIEIIFKDSEYQKNYVMPQFYHSILWRIIYVNVKENVQMHIEIFPRAEHVLGFLI